MKLINKYSLLLTACFLLLIGCSEKVTHSATEDSNTPTTNQSSEEILVSSKSHENSRMQYKLVASKYSNKSDVWALAKNMLDGFNEEDYKRLYDLVYEQDIPTLQQHVAQGKLSYENLTKWYIYRILKYESDDRLTLHSIISIMPNAVAEAIKKDQGKSPKDHPVYGMPILLKDNINASGQPTTAGAIALANNNTNDATIVKNLKAKGAIILGKANLSEWAYYFCDGCPLGYSAVGGQTLNPYGRGVFETGGSSAASGTTMAANYAAAAVGTETAGSILSPSSQNSIVGLKPSIGVLSRSGIVPISSTLDTPGPMTRSVIDNAILLSAMYGIDNTDATTIGVVRNDNFVSAVLKGDNTNYTLAANTNYLNTDDIYSKIVEKMRAKGVKIVEYTPEDIGLDGFVSMLDFDMQRDLPNYLNNYANGDIPVNTVASVINYNLQDSTLRAPYGQGRFISSRDDSTSDTEMKAIKQRLEKDTRSEYNRIFDKTGADALLSINNYDAAHAAMAKYPCLAMPMGYTDSGEPKAMTFIGKQYDESTLLKIGSYFESQIFKRTPPKGY